MVTCRVRITTFIIDPNHWSLLLPLFNHSFRTSFFPSRWKDTRVILLAKKDPICSPSVTRPISLIDCFQKICEKLFLSRFRSVLSRRGILPNCQSGFRERSRLQTRVLLFLDDVYMYMSNSAPVASIFIDFKSAFDQLWFLGCIGKLKRLGIPILFCNWIESWLVNRRCFIEINNKKSRWFEIEKGGPQGSVLTPTIFITYHSDLDISLPSSVNHLFADDLVGVISGQIGLKFSDQCLDLEKRCKNFLDHLEYYSLLSDQPINLDKSVAMFSARAIGNPKFNIYFNDSPHSMIKWVSDFRYLGYIISSKLGWGKLLKSFMIRVRQRVCLVRSFTLFGCSSPLLRKALFSSFVLPLFTWLYPIFPLLSKKQQDDLSHFYSTCLRRVLFCLHWNDVLFSFALDEKMLIDRCAIYWNKYLISLSDSIDGILLFEKANLTALRSWWLEKKFPISCLRQSKRFVVHQSILDKVISWLSSVPDRSSTPFYESDELLLLEDFAITF